MSHSDPDFAKQLAWLGECSDDQIKRRIEAELEHRGNRSRRILAGLLLIVALLYALAWSTLAGAANAPVIADEWDEDCIWWPENPRWSDGSGEIAAPELAEVRIERALSAAGPWMLLQAVKSGYSYCYRPVPIGTAYYRAVTALSTGALSAPGPVASTLTTAPTQPGPLLTAGGDVYQASPNWTNFSWKLGAKVGTIPPLMKCDATRKIGTDYFRVTSPITWIAGKKDYVVAKCEAS